MIRGRGTLAGVALHIIEDFAYGWGNDRWYEDNKKLRPRLFDRVNRYTLNQFLQVVVDEKRSIISDSGAPSYLWWYIGVDRYGEIEPVIDMGKLSPEVVYKRLVGYGKRTEERYRKHDMMPWSMIEEEGKWALAFPESRDDRTFYDTGRDYMVKYGLSFGQQFLTRYEANFYTSSYEEETDLDEVGELIYASVPRWHDIPYSVDNTLPEFRGFDT